MHRFAQLRQKQRQPRVLFIPGSGTKEGLFGTLVEPAAGGRTLEILNESDYEYSLNGNKQTNN